MLFGSQGGGEAAGGAGGVDVRAVLGFGTGWGFVGGDYGVGWWEDGEGGEGMRGFCEGCEGGLRVVEVFVVGAAEEGLGEGF